MSEQHRPRADDHLVEPLYGALNERRESRAPDPRWKILWVVIGAAAIGWIVWRQAF
jgi:hypothetical protein